MKASDLSLNYAHVCMFQDDTQIKLVNSFRKWVLCETAVPLLKQWCDKFTACSSSFGEQGLFCFIKMPLSGKHCSPCTTFMHHNVPAVDVLGMLFLKV